MFYINGFSKFYFEKFHSKSSICQLLKAMKNLCKLLLGPE